MHNCGYTVGLFSWDYVKMCLYCWDVYIINTHTYIYIYNLFASTVNEIITQIMRSHEMAVASTSACCIKIMVSKHCVKRFQTRRFWPRCFDLLGLNRVFGTKYISITGFIHNIFFLYIQTSTIVVRDIFFKQKIISCSRHTVVIRSFFLHVLWYLP